VIAFLLSLFAAGIPFWSIPYAKASLPNSLISYGLVLVVVTAGWLCATSRASFRNAVLAAGLAPPGAVFIRIVAGVIQDSTSHNLWPLVLILAAAVSFPLALLGA
jgi:hypothetical protein